MSRGESYGGGKSSLGYLFGSDHNQPSSQTPASPSLSKPPWGDDNTTADDEKLMKNHHSPTTQKQNITNNYRRAQGQNSGNFITERPSTKVQSAPGGDSSLGYLFGDKK